MKILLTGKQGQVGFELQRALAPLGEICAVDQPECDLADGLAIRDLVRSLKPDVIVNPAAYTAVDKAESEPELAHAINTVAPGVLGEEAAKQGAWVVHYSTDYVFDGIKPGAYMEDDVTNPQSVYGRTKRAGEIAVQQSGARHLIFRTSWVVGAHGRNFAKTILRQQRRERGEHFRFGLYHLVAGGETSWCDYARFVVSEALAAGKSLKLLPDSIRAITSSEYPTPASRPANSRLDTSKLRSTFDLELPPWQSGVRHILQQILADGE
jgi:dTDP-4-dehydrorhamnose reductase